MKKIFSTAVLSVLIPLSGCTSSPQKIELKDAVAELVQNCKGKVNVSYTNKRGMGETVNATCDNSNMEEVVTAKGSAADPEGAKKSTKRTYW